MKLHNSQTLKALTYLQEKHELQSASTYGEPGYSDPKNQILFADWNDVPDNLQRYLEAQGFELEWYDEWTQVNDKAYRISGDSYHWECQVHMAQDGEYLTPDDSASVWIEELAVQAPGQPIYFLPRRISDEELLCEGYEKREDYLNPDVISAAAFKDGAESVVFRKTENSPWYIIFDCWVKKEETKE